MLEPGARLADVGDSVIDVRVAVLTTRFAVPETLLKVAVTVTPLEPVGATPRSLPWKVTLAWAGLDEVQVESRVTSCDVPSENTAVAWKICVAPTGIVAVMGVTVMLLGVALVTSMVMDCEIDCRVAEIVTGLSIIGTEAAALTNPVFWTTVAIVISLDCQLTWLVMSSVLPLLNVPMAEYC